jgi:hypothetical protein
MCFYCMVQWELGKARSGGCCGGGPPGVHGGRGEVGEPASGKMNIWGGGGGCVTSEYFHR